VQQQVIQPIFQGKDIIASAQTGTGKTAAFLLPVVNKIITEPHDEHLINAVIIVPTRELAVQIAQTMEGLSYFTRCELYRRIWRWRWQFLYHGEKSIVERGGCGDLHTRPHDRPPEHGLCKNAGCKIPDTG
jgi:superfamily II DNA/RNA helicase